jgi:predicted RNA-binding protein associated with RNAse of E/G family
MSWPAMLEIKRTLDGREKHFQCKWLDGDPTRGRVMVLFVSTEDMLVHGVALPAGTVTFGHFWTDRPYNAYHWMNPRGETIGIYFNLSDRTQMTNDLLQWRDLAVDILTTPGGRVEVLDEDELPAELDPELRRWIDRGKAAILDDPNRAIGEIEALSRAVAADLFGSRRF